MTTFSDLMEKAATSKGGDGDYDNLEDGSYIAKLTGCFRNKAKNGEGRNQTNCDWEVLEGPKKGETHRSWHNLDHHVGISIMQKEFAMMGIIVPTNLTSVEQVDPYIREAQAMSPTCQIKLFTKKTPKGEFQNTKLITVLGVSATDVPAPVVPEEPEATLSVGAKIKYLYNKVEVEGIISKVDGAAQTVDTVLHKEIALGNITALLG